METESKVIGKAQTEPWLILGMRESLPAVPVSEETHICRQAEVFVYGVAYSRLGSYADAVSAFAFIGVIITELQCRFPKKIETVESVYEVSQVRCHGIGVAVHSFMLAVFVTKHGSESETLACTETNVGSEADTSLPVIVVVPETYSTTNVYLCYAA